MPDGGCGIITCNLRGHATGKYAQNRFLSPHRCRDVLLS
ncbi:putative membrane protein [Escherichia coli P12b]|nr:putative membrane protein [Escherichia coli P12b]